MTLCCFAVCKSPFLPLEALATWVPMTWVSWMIAPATSEELESEGEKIQNDEESVVQEEIVPVPVTHDIKRTQTREQNM